MNNPKSPRLRILTRSDMEDINLEPSLVIRAVEDGFLALETGVSECPTKMMIDLPVESRDSIAFSMLGFDANRDLVGYKTSYRYGSDNPDKYYTTISLYDDENGMPYVLMDCQKVGASRTPATTALIARECAGPEPRTATVFGTGIQAVNTLPYLLTAVPSLKTLRLHGTHAGGLRKCKEVFHQWFPNREIELVEQDDESVKSAVQDSDITVVSSGRAWHPPIQTEWIPEGGVLISVASKGVADGAVAAADRVVATSAGQFELVGQRLLQDKRVSLDATVPEILTGKAQSRTSENERIFAFSTGMIITDIPIAQELAVRAFAAGRGTEVPLWS
ncbi:MAG: ornithine cyclodeaminase [Corynebacterium sp.]|uniref:ornithine cyclodeaminase n=1 Tax=Corynebacterium sp. TaxID=1720 RepID=UPI0026DC0BBD|nr:ornithine cyclodeaminase [Corynebacterium sp.]MDO5030862.1 ornithine cyclodeaminase [Corynebacterium sp.]